MNVKNNPKASTVTKLKKIDKYYWLNKGYEMVDGGLKRSHEQIKSITTYINGLLGVYVIGTIIDSIYMEVDSFWKLLIVMLPVIIIKWSLYYGEISVLPNFKSFYPDSADSSEITYYQYLNEAESHIKKLKKYALISTITLLSVLVLTTWFTIQSKTKTTLNKDELNITKLKLKKVEDELKLINEKDIYELNSKITKERQLFLESALPKNKLIHMKFTDTKQKVLLDKKILIGNSGTLYFDYMLSELSTTKDSLYVSIQYSLNNNETRRIKQLILLNKN